MAFVIEDGTGKRDATAYCDIAFADEYHVDRGNAGWTGDDAVKMASLVRATDYLRRYSGRWKGVQTYEHQGLDWPRFGVYVTDALPPLSSNPLLTTELAPGMLPENEVPLVIRQATADLALRAMAAPLEPDQPRGGKIKERTVGPITTIWADDAPAGTSFPTIEAMLMPLLRGGGGMSVMPLLRA